MGQVAFPTLRAAVLAAGMLVVHPAFAEDDPVKSVTLKLEGACDPKNSRLFAESAHGSKTIVATLRWNLSGSKRIATEKFQISPGGRIEVGCAAQADVVSAVFVD